MDSNDGDARIRKKAVLPREDRGKIVRADRGIVDQLVRTTLLGGAAFYGVILLASGRTIAGVAALLVAILGFPFTGSIFACGVCGARLGLVSFVRRRCAHCGARLKGWGYP